MSYNAAKQIEQEFDRLCKTNSMFKEFVEFCPEASMEQSLESWKWVQGLVEKAIHRTIRDLTTHGKPATLDQPKDR